MFLSVVSIILGSFVIGYVAGYGVRSVIAFYDRHELR